MNREQKEHIKEDVRAIEHAKNDETAKDAALLLRNDIFRIGEHSRKDRREAIDLVHRMNVLDRAENPNLPKIVLLTDDQFPNVKSGTEIKYNNRTVVEGYKPQSESERSKQSSRHESSKPQHEQDAKVPSIATEQNR